MTVISGDLRFRAGRESETSLNRLCRRDGRNARICDTSHRYSDIYANSPSTTSANFLALFATSPLAPITVNLTVTPFNSSLSSSEGIGVSSDRLNAQLRMWICDWEGLEVEGRRRKPLTTMDSSKNQQDTVSAMPWP